MWTVENGKAKKVKVTLGNADAENQEILSGLKKDAQVIVNPNEKLEDGKEIGKYDKMIELKGINKTYKNGDQELRVLKDIDLEVEEENLWPLWVHLAQEIDLDERHWHWTARPAEYF